MGSINTDKLDPRVERAVGAAEEIIGEVADLPRSRMDGQIRQVKGKAREGLETARKALGGAADQANTLYTSAVERAQAVGDTVDPFVNEKPYVAAMIAGVAGFLIGALLLSRVPRVIYVRTPRR
jgi:ElaB/YqjD/DUF883 family membrane-anchored ribosome-binding protein